MEIALGNEVHSLGVPEGYGETEQQRGAKKLVHLKRWTRFLQAFLL